MLYCNACRADLTKAAKLFGVEETKTIHTKAHCLEIAPAMVDVVEVAEYMLLHGGHAKKCSYPSGDCECGFIDLDSVLLSLRDLQDKARRGYTEGT